MINDWMAKITSNLESKPLDADFEFGTRWFAAALFI
jgi:hypothetical protein